MLKRAKIDDYYDLPNKKNRNGLFLGTLVDGKIIEDKIPRIRSDTTSCFKCLVCQHIWNTSFTSISSNNSWCPKCSKNRKTLSDYYVLPKLRHKDGCYLGTMVDEFICPDTIPENSKINTAYWQCFKCQLSFNACYNSINCNSWCPTCPGTKIKKTIEYYRDIARKRFGIYMGVLIDGKLYPDDLPINVNQKNAVWKCLLCSHEFSGSLRSINAVYRWKCNCPM